MPQLRIDVELVGGSVQCWRGEVYGPRGARPVKAATLTEALEQIRAGAIAIGAPTPPPAPLEPVQMPDPIDRERLASVQKRRGGAGIRPATKPAEIVPPPRAPEPRWTRARAREAARGSGTH